MPKRRAQRTVLGVVSQQGGQMPDTGKVVINLATGLEGEAIDNPALRAELAAAV